MSLKVMTFPQLLLSLLFILRQHTQFPISESSRNIGASDELQTQSILELTLKDCFPLLKTNHVIPMRYLEDMFQPPDKVINWLRIPLGGVPKSCPANTLLPGSRRSCNAFTAT